MQTYADRVSRRVERCAARPGGLLPIWPDGTSRKPDPCPWRLSRPVVLGEGPPLLDEDLEVRTVNLPLTSLASDVQAVTAEIEKCAHPVILCGHSYGGMVISQAGLHPDVGHLIYLCAVVPAPGESMNDASAPGEGHLMAPMPAFADGFLLFDLAEAATTF